MAWGLRAGQGIRLIPGPPLRPWALALRPVFLERETGIEPATNSLEGCDSTTELLPPSCPLLLAPRHSPLPSSPLLSGGEGRVRTSVATRAADLQSAAIDRSATSPEPSFFVVPPARTVRAASGDLCFG